MTYHPLYRAKPRKYLTKHVYLGRGSAFQIYFPSVHYALDVSTTAFNICHLLPKGHRTRQGSRGVIAGPRLHQMLKGWRILDPRGERVKVPEVAQGAQDRGGGVRHGFAGDAGALLLDISLADPGGDQQSGDTTTQTVKVEGVVLAAWGGGRVSEVVRPGSEGRGHMVVEATGLVEAQDEEGLVPLGPGAQSVVDVLDQLLAVGDQTTGVHRVGADTAARGVDVAEFRQGTGCGIRVELFQGLDLVGVVGGVSPVVELGIGASATSRVPVVDPGVAGLGQLLEDGTLGEGVVVKGLIVGSVTIRSARGEGSPVGVGGLNLS